MKKICLVLGFMVISCGILFAAEQIVITTYYPSPYGSYDSLQAGKLGVGDNNGDGSLTSTDVPTTSGDTWIKGKVGIGTTSPGAKLHVAGGTIRVSGAGAPSTGGALCLNASGNLSKCSSGVDASGNCICP